MLNLTQNSLTGQERDELSPEVFCFVHPSPGLPLSSVDLTKDQ